jgi:hypothetical protein
LNDKTIGVAKDIINKKMGKNDFIKYCTEISKSVNIETDQSNTELLDNDEIEELRKYKYNEYYENFNELIIENTEIYQNNDTELENITVKMNNNDNVIVDNLNQECSKINYDKIKNKFLNIEIYGEENKKIDNELDNELDNNLVSIDIKQKENSCINIIFDNEKEYPKINNIDVE